MDADHVAHGAADGLSRHDDLLGEVELRGHIPLELGEQQVGHRVGAGDEGAEAADVGGQRGPGFPGERGQGLGEGEGHGVHAAVVHAGTAEDGNQRHGGEQRDGRGLHLGEGRAPGFLHVIGLHAVQRHGQDGDQRKGNGAGQEQVVDGRVHALIAEDVGEVEFEGGQPRLEAEFRDAGQHEDQADEGVGQPRAELGHVRVELGLAAGGDAAGPGGVPPVVRAEVPGLFRHAEAALGAVDENAEADEPADEGRQLGSERPRDDKVGNAEAYPGENAVFPCSEAFGPAALFTVEAGQEAEHDDGQDEGHGDVHHGAVLAHDLAEGRIGHAAVRDARVEDRLERRKAHHDGRAHRAEAHGETVEHEADDGGGHRREAEGQQERSRERRGRAETGRAFDEGREHVSDDDGLNAFVAADVLHPVLDGFHAAALFQCKEDQNGAENDDEHADGGDDALQRQRRDIAGGQSPHEYAADGADKPCKRHRFGCRPPHADHQDERHQNGQHRHHREQFNGHNDSFTLGKM